MTPLSRYRRAQRRLRTLFEPFTREHCPTCSTPCCRRPTWVRPVDIILVEELGFTLPATPHDSPEAARRLADLALGTEAEAETPGWGEPCEYLGAEGCAFPPDLRPFGCAAFICGPMRRLLPPEELAPVE